MRNYLPIYKDGYYGGTLDQVTVTPTGNSTSKAPTTNGGSKSGNGAAWANAIFGNLGSIGTGVANIIAASKLGNNDNGNTTGSNGQLDLGNTGGKTNYAMIGGVAFGLILILALVFSGKKMKMA